MTKIAISPNVSGTGTFTIAAPDSNTDRTLTLPDAGGVVATQEYIPTALNATGSAPIYACRAWVNFDGTGTVAIRASGNVSSITDGGNGSYTVNFATAMPDVNYAVVGIANASNSQARIATASQFTVSNLVVNSRIDTASASSSNRVDVEFFSVAVFR